MYYEQLLRQICGCQAALPWGTYINCLTVLQRCGKIIYYFNTLTDCLKSINTPSPIVGLIDQKRTLKQRHNRYLQYPQNYVAARRSRTRQLLVVGGPRAFAQSNNFDDSAEAIYRMIQVFFVRLSLANR